MSSSLNDLRNFRMTKANKIANGRKRIRVMSDSSDDEQKSKQLVESPTKKVESPTKKEMSLTSIKEKEDSLQQLRQITGGNIDYMVLQDVLARNDWNVENAYDALEKDPKYSNRLKHSPQKSSVEVSKPMTSFTSAPIKKSTKVRIILKTTTNLINI